MRSLLLVVLCFAIPPAQAADTEVAAHPDVSKIDSGDTAWVLASAGLVMLMTPGLAFFYGGLVRKKNVLSVLMQCMMVLCLISLQWVLFGYSLAFGPDVGGRHRQPGLGGACSGVGVTPNADYAPTVPHTAFMIFQAMFAVITPGLILGAFAERMRFGAFCIFSLLWATLVYDPVCHWVWGTGGFLKAMGVLDFAGGIVVHINGGHVGPGGGPVPRAAAGLPAHDVAAAQPAVGGAGGGPAVVRLVRLQRRQRPVGRLAWRPSAFVATHVAGAAAGSPGRCSTGGSTSGRRCSA